MGSCLSTVFPHGMPGTSRRGSPNKGGEQLPRDEGSVPLPKDEGNSSLPNDEDTLRLPKDEGNSQLPKDDDTIRLPKIDDHTHLPKAEDDTRLPEVADKKTGVAAPKRRALLIGICYTSPTNTWSPLDGPHGDVDRCEDLLTSA